MQFCFVNTEKKGEVNGEADGQESDGNEGSVQHRYFIRLSYKGTGLAGWQRQDNAPTVQQKLDDALSLILSAPIKTKGSGRTDAGVHALLQVCHFDIDRQIAEEALVLSLNRLLPKHIAIIDIVAVPPTLHARHSATMRGYIYRMHWAKNPFLFGVSAFIWPQPDVSLMNEALQSILGSHDFRSFGKQMPHETHHRCRVQKAEWTPSPSADELILTIDANRFLRAMVRALVQASIEIGQRKQPPSYIQTCLAAQLVQIPNALAPPEGLYLYKVEYSGGNN